MSSWSFSYRCTQYQWEKNSYWASVHRAFSQRREKQGCFFGYFFVWVPIFDPTLVQYFIQIPHIIFCCPSVSTYDQWWFEQKKSPHFREKYLVLSYLMARFRLAFGSHKPYQNAMYTMKIMKKVHQQRELPITFNRMKIWTKKKNTKILNEAHTSFTTGNRRHDAPVLWMVGYTLHG